MTCTQIRENIDLFLHYELEEEALRPFKRHIHSCHACAEILEQERQLFAEIQELPQAKCPDKVVEKIFRKAGMTGTKYRRPASILALIQFSGFLRTPRLLLSGVLLLVAIIAGSLYLTPETDDYAKKIAYDFTEAELRQQKALIEKALAPLFKTVRQSEILTKNEIIRANVIELAQKSFLKAIHPLSKER